jgi:hypothetical protein
MPAKAGIQPFSPLLRLDPGLRRGDGRPSPLHLHVMPAKAGIRFRFKTGANSTGRPLKPSFSDLQLALVVVEC